MGLMVIMSKASEACDNDGFEYNDPPQFSSYAKQRNYVGHD
jgi:hypothetical protein